MEKSVNRFRVRGVWLMMALLVAAGGLAGCTAMKTGHGGRMAVKTLWQSGDQYVAVEKQDRLTGAAVPPNEHPADISADRLRSALGSIEVHLPGRETAIQLFNDSELDILSGNIRDGLASAGPDEDVTFAVIGHYTTLLGVFKERKATTGRVFYQDGQLNVIFGDVLRDVRENEDRRLYPFLPGSRNAAAPHAWALAEKPGSEVFTMNRPDWITFPRARHVVPAGGAGTRVKDVTTAEPREIPAMAVKKSVEERLMILNDLKSKRLITDDEYQSKRREILNEL